MPSLRLGTKALTAELRRLAAEVVPSTDPSVLEAQSREQILSALIWKQALGYWDYDTDANGNKTKKYHPPVAWCQQFLFERMEGKAPVAMPENESGMKAADKVRQLARDRVAALTSARTGPPTYKP